MKYVRSGSATVTLARIQVSPTSHIIWRITTNGNQSTCGLSAPLPVTRISTNPMLTNWLAIPTSTARTGMSSIGSITFLTRWMFCLIDSAPVVRASMKPRYGTRPQNT